MIKEQMKREFKPSEIEMAVRHILAHYPEARSNDKVLWLLYWQVIDKIEIPDEFKQAFIRRASHPESIRRWRQKIQHDGDYLPREEIMQQRKRKEEQIRKYWSQKRLTE